MDAGDPEFDDATGGGTSRIGPGAVPAGAGDIGDKPRDVVGAGPGTTDR
jgi:hypothetical protein